MDFFKKLSELDEMETKETPKAKSIAAKILKKICKAMEKLGLPYTCNKDTDNLSLNSKTIEDGLDINVYLSVDSLYRQILLLSILPFKFDTADYEKASLACDVINEMLFFGCFYLDKQYGYITYRANSVWRSGKQADEDIYYFILKSIITVYTFNEGVANLANGASLDQVIADWEN